VKGRAGFEQLAERIDASYAAAGSDVDADAVDQAIGLLDRGEVRVAEPTDAGWIVNEWAKRAVLLYFRARGLETTESGPFLPPSPATALTCLPASSSCRAT
jgi:tetrahydrodipicolinate N-succinyltransferase